MESPALEDEEQDGEEGDEHDGVDGEDLNLLPEVFFLLLIELIFSIDLCINIEWCGLLDLVSAIPLIAENGVICRGNRY